MLASAADDFRKSPYLTYQPEAASSEPPRASICIPSHDTLRRWGSGTLPAMATPIAGAAELCPTSRP